MIFDDLNIIISYFRLRQKSKDYIIKKLNVYTAISILSLNILSCSDSVDHQLTPNMSSTAEVSDEVSSHLVNSSSQNNISRVEISSSSNSQNSSSESNFSLGKQVQQIEIEGSTREYTLYLPKSYSTSDALPLLFSIHGLGSNMDFNFDYTKFDQLAEAENFILVHPNAQNKSWATSAENNSDIIFIQNLIDYLQNEYKVNSQRIYITGMSNGGFFSFALACQVSEKIAAISSVTGTMYRPGINSCQPSKPMPILQIHGTEDNIVNYSTVENVIEYWTSHNNTELSPSSMVLPDIDTEDGSTVEKFIYANGDKGVEVQHLKVIGGSHQWPGYQGNMDIDASKVVWDFMKEYDLNLK